MSLRVPKPAALFLDLDGTLVDSRSDIAIACNAARVAHGRPPLPESVVVGMIGDGARALMAKAFAVDEGDPLLDSAVASFQASYVAHPCVHTTFHAGARELLEYAESIRLPRVVVTNKPRAVSVLLLEHLGVASHFPFIWAGGDGPLKPSPVGVLAMAKHLGIDPRLAWMIGDGPQDVGAGKAAGCFTVGVPGIADRERLVASEPSLLCESLIEVRRLVAAAAA